MITIKIDGMSCGHCRAAVEQALTQVEGVTAVLEVSLEEGMAQVEGHARPEALVAAIEQAGYEAHIAT